MIDIEIQISISERSSGWAATIVMSLCHCGENVMLENSYETALPFVSKLALQVFVGCGRTALLSATHETKKKDDFNILA